MMTDQEWDHFVEIYRELCTARADMWAMAVMLRAARLALQDDHPDQAMRTLSDWEGQMPEIRQNTLYKRLVAAYEAELDQAQAQRDEAALIEYLSKAPPPEYLN
jgi:hypothetical protein